MTAGKPTEVNSRHKKRTSGKSSFFSSMDFEVATERKPSITDPRFDHIERHSIERVAN